jgi:hypothetical protein
MALAGGDQRYLNPGELRGLDIIASQALRARLIKLHSKKLHRRGFRKQEVDFDTSSSLVIRVVDPKGLPLGAL